MAPEGLLQLSGATLCACVTWRTPSALHCHLDHAVPFLFKQLVAPVSYTHLTCQKRNSFMTELSGSIMVLTKAERAVPVAVPANASLIEVGPP